MKCNQLALRALLLSLLLVLSACGGEATDVSGSESLPSPVPGGIDGDHPVSGPNGQTPVSPEELANLPYVNAGQRQYTDTNVAISLTGQAEAADGAEIVQVLWTQIHGPEVTLPYPGSLENLILIPDWQEPAQLEFRLIVVDDEGRINSATTTVIVQPQPRFLSVAGAAVEASAEQVLFRLTLSRPSNRPVTVSYTTEADSALADVDFVATSGDIVFEPEQLVATVAVPLLDNPNQREDLTFRLVVTQISEGELSVNQGVAIIRYFEGPVLFNRVDFNAFIGPASSQITFVQPVQGYQLIQTQEDPCLPSEILTCSDANFRIIEGLSLYDELLSWEFDGFFWLSRDEEVSNPLHVQGLDGNSGSPGDSAPPARAGHHLLSFNDRLWLIGGYTPINSDERDFHDDVWSSSDGIYWEQMADGIMGGDLESSFDKAVVHNGQIWLLDSYNDTLYHSGNGIEWTDIPEQVLDYGYGAFELFSFDDQLFWISNGENSEPRIWTYAIDENEWIEESTVTGLTYFYGGGKIVTFNDRLWMIGSMDGSSSNNLSGIWVSDNGTDWEPASGVSENVQFSYQHIEHLVASDEGMWLMHAGSDYIEVSYSADGLEWDQEWVDSLSGQSGMPYGLALGVFNGRLWLHGGELYDGYYDEEEDTWIDQTRALYETWTTEGVNWQRVFRGSFEFMPPVLVDGM